MEKPRQADLTCSPPLRSSLGGGVLFPLHRIQLSWQQGTARRYKFSKFRDSGELEKLSQHQYGGQGWGLCHNGRFLVMSNGSEWLQFRDPVTFEVGPPIFQSLSCSL